MSTQEHKKRRRGNVVIIFALGLIVLLGFAALVVDIGSLFQVESQLQVATEAAALAGASHIDETAEGIDRAETAAWAVGTENPVTEIPMPAEELLLEFGVWSGSSFTPSEDPKAINAIKVVAEPRTVHTPFAGAAWNLGLHDVSASAIAIRPPPVPVDAVDCFLPMIVPNCRIEEIAADGHPWVESFVLANDSEDTIGWAHVDPGANADSVGSALEGMAAGECPINVGIEDEVSVNNGVQASTLHTIRDILRTSGDAWDTDLWGPKPAQDDNSGFTEQEYLGLGVLQGALMVLDEGGALCESVAFNQTAIVDGFVWGVVFDMFPGPGSHKGVQVYIDFEHDFETPGDPGSGSGNVLTRPPGRLVE